jgi:hypothetical protein
MIQRYYWPPVPLNGDTSKSVCYVKEADLLASLRRVREKVETREKFYHPLAKYYLSEENRAILAIIDEAIKEVKG